MKRGRVDQRLAQYMHDGWRLSIEWGIYDV